MSTQQTAKPTIHEKKVAALKPDWISICIFATLFTGVVAACWFVVAIFCEQFERHEYGLLYAAMSLTAVFIGVSVILAIRETNNILHQILKSQRVDDSKT